LSLSSSASEGACQRSRSTKKSEKYFPHLTNRTKIVTAEMHNDAGIAGAALAGIPDRSTVQAAE
jgi:hypothetical protein